MDEESSAAHEEGDSSAVHEEGEQRTTRGQGGGGGSGAAAPNQPPDGHAHFVAAGLDPGARCWQTGFCVIGEESLQDRKARLETGEGEDAAPYHAGALSFCRREGQVEGELQAQQLRGRERIARMQQRGDRLAAHGPALARALGCPQHKLHKKAKRKRTGARAAKRKEYDKMSRVTASFHWRAVNVLSRLDEVYVGDMDGAKVLQKGKKGKRRALPGPTAWVLQHACFAKFRERLAARCSERGGKCHFVPEAFSSASTGCCGRRQRVGKDVRAARGPQGRGG